MTRFCSVIAIALSLSAGVLACSTDDDREAGAGESESALRALTTAEIVGTIAYGETKSVDYSDSPLYRAYKFSTAAGDEFEIWVRSNGGDARAWLLSSTFATMETNKDASSSTRDAHIRRKVTRAGTYYIALRDENREDNTFTVSLTKLNAGGNNGGGTGGNGGGNGGGASTTVDPFDDGLANGTPISAAEATALFTPGSTRVDLGNFAMAQRTRTCNATTGCTPWMRNDQVTLAYMTYELWNPGPGWSNQKSCWKYGAVPFSSVTGSMSLSVTGPNKFDLGLSSTATGDVKCTNATSRAACDAFTSKLASRPDSGPGCSLPNPMGSGFEPTAYPSTVPLFDSGGTSTTQPRLSMSLLVTSKYVYGRSAFKSKADASGTTTETEYALYGLTAKGATPRLGSGGGAACTPKTCGSQGATCGTISDGCGGTLQCGGCDYPYSCGTDNKCKLPAGCNLQPCYAGATVAYTCCSSGQITCQNGRGCTCYDACM